ncbi:MAG: mechanosensitive ion channel family protein [Lactobacillales bacterium]|jgi:small conductance mechanosensitive channel|nr:mechanosensitive ion channel family protein [Lactobacillales bacterium]
MMNFWQKYFYSIDWNNVLRELITTGIHLFLTVVFFLLIFKIGKRIIERAYFSYAKKTMVSEGRAKTIKRLVDSVFGYTIFFFAVYTCLVVLGVPIGSLLAGAGIVGLAIGLGAQGFMNDLITGFFIIMEQQMDVGDMVKLQNLIIEGTVVSVGIRTTKIQSNEGYIHYVPNRNITTVTNLSRSDIQVIVDIRIVPEEGIEKITEIIEKTTEKLSETYKFKIAKVPKVFGLVDLGGGNFVIRTILFAVNGEQKHLKQVFTTEYIQGLTAESFTIPTSTFIAKPSGV